MSLYRGYMGLDYTDPLGKQITATIGKPTDLKGKCGDLLQASWRFGLPRGHKTKGWLIQKVTVSCSVGKCYQSPGLTLETTCGPEVYPPTCRCNLPEPKTFTYYEAWRVGFNNRRPTNPPGYDATLHDDTASFPSQPNTCGSYYQKGELRLYPDTLTGDISTNTDWPADGREFGQDTECGTSAKGLYAFDGKDGPPDFWKDNDPVDSGARWFKTNWRCCLCDKKKFRRVTADASKK